MKKKQTLVQKANSQNDKYKLYKKKIDDIFEEVANQKQQAFGKWGDCFGDIEQFLTGALGQAEEELINVMKQIYQVKEIFQAIFEEDNQNLQEEEFMDLLDSNKKRILVLVKEQIDLNVNELPSQIKVSKSVQRKCQNMQKKEKKEAHHLKDFNAFGNLEEIKPQSFKKKKQTYADHRQNKQSKNINQSKIVNKSKIKKSRLHQEQNQPEQQQEIIEKENQKINGGDLQVQVKFLVSKLDPKYEWEQYNLFQIMKYYINYSLAQNPVQVHKPTKEVVILQDTIYEKSKDAGNYFFDPFCQAVEMKIKRKNDQPFLTSFQVKGDVDIKAKDITEAKDWRKSLFIDPAEDIRKLIKLMCERKQQSKEMVEKVTNAFRKVGGVNKIKDLYEWTKEDYAKIQLKTTWVYELQEQIQKIRDASSQTLNKRKKKIHQQKQECLRISNAHKVLRYVVYKALGSQTLDLIPYLNYDNMLNAIAIVRKQIINQQLLNELQTYFFQFAATPKQDDKVRGFSRGMVLFGPPGTGKTVVTEALPNIIGFHLIEKGLSAADFMKSLVGQSSRMIKDLVNRAKLSPHLLCSIGIDQVDGLVPDRKDKEQKNKGEGISMLLSVIGGNKDVPNLVFMTSTNHLKKIDEAIRRRLSGQFQVGRLTPEARKVIILKNLDYFKQVNKQPTQQKQMFDYLVLITSNFTGAALQRLITDLANLIRRKQMQKKSTILSKREVTQTATKIAKQFSITLGVFTLPEIYSNKQNSKYLFSEQFMHRISNQFVLLTSQNKKQFKLCYTNETQHYENGKLVSQHDMQFQIFTITNVDDRKSQVQLLRDWVNQGNQNGSKKIEIQVCQKTRDVNINTYLQNVKRKFTHRKQITILIIQDLMDYPGTIIFQTNAFKSPKQNLFVFIFTNHKESLNALNWIRKQDRSYSGKIFVELTDEAKMAFQLNTPADDDTKLHFKHFLKSERTNASNDVIPELVQFFTTRNVSYILLIDYQLLLQNGAYNDQKMFEIIEEKMNEALNYQNVSVIINVDSLIVLTQNASDSSMGRSQSYSIADNNMYRLLLHYMKQFASVDPIEVLKNRKQKWMGIIAKNKELIKILKKDLTWPKTPKQRADKKAQQKMEQEKECQRCGVWYTEKQNQQERKCMQHPGYIIDIRGKSLQTVMTANEAKVLQLKYKNNSKQKSTNQNLFVYACCLKGLGEQGEKAYRHKTKGENKDQVQEERESRVKEWTQICSKL